MGDVLAHLRHLEAPGVKIEDWPGLYNETVAGTLGAVSFKAFSFEDGAIGIGIRKSGGKVTDGNMEPFWRHWGYERVKAFERYDRSLGMCIVINKDEVEKMIKAAPKGTDRGPVAEVTCDCCGVSDNVRADYERVSADKFKVNEGQVIQKVTHQGWSWIKGTLRCPECEAKRRQKDNPVNNVLNMPKTEEPRQPTRDQKREIIALLNEVYDTKTGRYTGGETDKTVADTIGGGVMLGWVAQVREDLFGPDGGNDDLVELRDEVQAAIFECNAVAKQCQEDIERATNTLKSYNGVRDKLAEVLARIEKLRKAVGPKADNI